MRAMIIREFGDANVFSLGEVANPEIASGQVLIKVAASSVNQLDIKMRSGAVPAITPPFPAILNGDVAGTVVKVATDVKHIAVGDEVYGVAGGIGHVPGALAEYMAVDARLIAKKPQSLNFLTSAGVPLVGITAYIGIMQKVRIKPGMQVLVHGGLGGVGHLAVQLAKAQGAIVTATVASSEQFAQAREFGADNTVDFRSEKVADYVNRITNGTGFDVIYDTVGGPNLNNSLAAIKNFGDIVTTVARTTLDITPLHDKSANLHVVFMMLPLLYEEGRAAYHHYLTELATLIDQQKVRLLSDPTTFKFSEITKAHQYLESGKAQGKVLLECDL
ncbi:MAG: zinc-binding dehydrogenase [Legionellales bacterium]|nr:zinc-binding dehydrogenase [Legionellales bacterium]